MRTRRDNLDGSSSAAGANSDKPPIMSSTTPTKRVWTWKICRLSSESRANSSSQWKRRGKGQVHERQADLQRASDAKMGLVVHAVVLSSKRWTHRVSASSRATCKPACEKVRIQVARDRKWKQPGP